MRTIEGMIRRRAQQRSEENKAKRRHRYDTAHKKEQREKRKKTVLDHYGNCCSCCGETMKEFLTIDHINNDGHEHKKQIKSNNSDTLYRWLIKNNFPEGFRIHCYNCNCGRARR
jgi:hypothetical protein